MTLLYTLYMHCYTCTNITNTRASERVGSFTRISQHLLQVALGSDNAIECLEGTDHPRTAVVIMVGFLVVFVLLGLNMLIAMMAKSFDIIWEQQVRMPASSFDPPCISPLLLPKPLLSLPRLAA